MGTRLLDDDSLKPLGGFKVKRLITATAIIGGLCIVGSALAHVPGRVNCGKLFTAAHTEATARDIYSGTKTITLAKLQRLGHMELCQVRVSERTPVRAYSHKQAALHAARVARPPAVAVSVTTGGGMTPLVSCIIKNESGGNPQAVSPNGIYKGIGQWSAAAWAEDGGTRYASTPLLASYGQQLAVLEGEGPTAQAQQQGQYDGCA